MPIYHNLNGTIREVKVIFKRNGDDHRIIKEAYHDSDGTPKKYFTAYTEARISSDMDNVNVKDLFSDVLWSSGIEKHLYIDSGVSIGSSSSTSASMTIPSDLDGILFIENEGSIDGRGGAGGSGTGNGADGGDAIETTNASTAAKVCLTNNGNIRGGGGGGGGGQSSSVVNLGSATNPTNDGGPCINGSGQAVQGATTACVQTYGSGASCSSSNSKCSGGDEVTYTCNQCTRSVSVTSTGGTGQGSQGAATNGGSGAGNGGAFGEAGTDGTGSGGAAGAGVTNLSSLQCLINSGTLTGDFVEINMNMTDVSVDSLFTDYSSATNKILIVGNDATVGATSTSNPAIDIPAGLGGTLTVFNNSVIVGAGGASNGGNGGNAIDVDSGVASNVTISNSGSIYAGGGGGGNGGSFTQSQQVVLASCFFQQGGNENSPPSSNTMRALCSAIYGGNSISGYHVCKGGGSVCSGAATCQGDSSYAGATCLGTSNVTVAGAAGGVGQGYNQDAGTGATNAGGSGGNGGTYGTDGTDGTNAGSGTGATAGGSAGTAITNQSSITLNNTGTILG